MNTTVKVIPLADIAYVGDDGNHVHLPGDVPASVPASVADDLCFLYRRAKYLNRLDVPKERERCAGRLVATAAEIAAAAARVKWRRENPLRQL